MNDENANPWYNPGGSALAEPDAGRPAGGRTVPSIFSLPLPILFEDDGYEEMGESIIHVTTAEIIHICLKMHLAGTGYQVLSNLNLYYKVDDDALTEMRRWPYVSPDVMVVAPYQPLPLKTASYRIGRDGPSPVIVVEVLSARSAQQRDLDEKLIVYAKLRVDEYLLVDGTGEYLPERLLLKRLEPLTLAWRDERDGDGGVTSRWGFRLIFDADGQVRVVNAGNGQPYLRPDEAHAEHLARLEAEKALMEVESARQAAESARQAAEQAMTQAEQARRAAEKALAEEAARRAEIEKQAQALEAELAQLRRIVSGDV